MKILVLVKQVPATEAQLRIEVGEKWVEVAGSDQYQLNRFDEFAVEEAILLKEANPDTTIDIVSVGPPRAAQAIKRALGMGSQRGIHIVTEEGYLSPFLTASWIASYAAGKGYDLMLAGVMSEDAMQGQVGPMVAELVGLPCATAVIELSLQAEGLTVRREIEGGMREIVELPLPALVTVQSGINKPRYPSLSNIMRTKNMPLETIPASSLEVQEPTEEVIKVGAPPRMRDALFLSGTPQEKAAELLKILGSRISIR